MSSYPMLVSVGLVAVAAGTTTAGQLSTSIPPAQLLLGPAALVLIAAVLHTLDARCGR